MQTAHEASIKESHRHSIFNLTVTGVSGAYPAVAWQRGSVSLSPMVRDGPMNRVAFRAYLEQVPKLTLRRRESMTLGNLSAHKSEKVCRAIKVVGTILFKLPSHVPYNNPMGKVISTSTAILRKLAVRTIARV